MKNKKNMQQEVDAKTESKNSNFPRRKHRHVPSFSIREGNFQPDWLETLKKQNFMQLVYTVKTVKKSRFFQRYFSIQYI